MDGQLRNMTAIYLFKGEKVLLLHRNGGKVANQLWTGSAGGHFENYELNNATACVLREMKEELGLSLENTENLSLRYITLRNTQGEIRQNYYFFASLTEETNAELVSNEGDCKWFSLNEICQLEMPFTAKYVVKHYIDEGRFTDCLYVGVATESAVNFHQLAKN